MFRFLTLTNRRQEKRSVAFSDRRNAKKHEAENGWNNTHCKEIKHPLWEGTLQEQGGELGLIAAGREMCASLFTRPGSGVSGGGGFATKSRLRLRKYFDKFHLNLNDGETRPGNRKQPSLAGLPGVWPAILQRGPLRLASTPGRWHSLAPGPVRLECRISTVLVALL